MVSKLLWVFFTSKTGEERNLIWRFQHIYFLFVSLEWGKNCQNPTPSDFRRYNLSPTNRPCPMSFPCFSLRAHPDALNPQASCLFFRCVVNILCYIYRFILLYIFYPKPPFRFFGVPITNLNFFVWPPTSNKLRRSTAPPWEVVYIVSTWHERFSVDHEMFGLYRLRCKLFLPVTRKSESISHQTQTGRFSTKVPAREGRC